MVGRFPDEENLELMLEIQEFRLPGEDGGSVLGSLGLFGEGCA